MHPLTHHDAGDEAVIHVSPFNTQEFKVQWNLLSRDCYNVASEKGFWPPDRNLGEVCALIHSEVSEVLEALRDNNPADSKIPEFSSAEVELADVVIRIMDLAYAKNWDVAGAIIAKLEYNKSRPHKHGRTF